MLVNDEVFCHLHKSFNLKLFCSIKNIIQILKRNFEVPKVQIGEQLKKEGGLNVIDDNLLFLGLNHWPKEHNLKHFGMACQERLVSVKALILHHKSDV